MKSNYPQLPVGAQTDQLNVWANKVVEIRQNEDISDWINLKNVFVSGRTTTRVPASATDVLPSDVIGDRVVSTDGTTMYILVMAGGSPQWGNVSLTGGGGSGGGGTVTSVAVTTANGVSATVTNPTTTPNLSFTLGAITPSSVNGTTATEIGYVSGVTSGIQAQLNNKASGTGSASGTNTGDTPSSGAAGAVQLSNGSGAFSSSSLSYVGGVLNLNGFNLTPSTFYTSGVVPGLLLQNATANTRTMLGITPNGTGNNADIWLFDSPDTTNNYSGIAWGLEGTSSSGSWGWNVVKNGAGVAHGIYFNATNGQSAASSNLYCDTSGNVGIGGVTSPGARLDVSGTARISSTTTLSNLAGTGVRPVTASASGVLATGTTTGSGNYVLSTSPTLVTPALGTPSAVVLTNGTGLVPSSGLAASGTASNTTFLRGDNTWAAPPNSGGTVTSVSVASANGFAGTVANPSTTPAITLSTSISGILKGNGTALSSATAGTDYQIPISLTTTGTSGAATFNTSTGVLNVPNYTTTATSTFTDSAFTIQNATTTTKQLKFDASAIAASTTRTLSAPDASGPIVLNNNTATITNKTINSSVVSIDDTAFVLNNTTVGGSISFSAIATTAGTTRQVTVPDANLTMVGTATTQTLTNKTLTAPAISAPVITGTISANGSTGTTGQVLTSQGSGSAAIWSTVSSGGGTTNTINTLQIDQTGTGQGTYGVLAGTINGTNAVFTTSFPYQSGTLQVDIDGPARYQGSAKDFTETSPGSGTFTFNTAPASSVTSIKVSYMRQSTSNFALTPVGVLATATANRQVNSNTYGANVDFSALPTSYAGSMTVPASGPSSPSVGSTYELTVFGTFQTPATPGAVVVKIKWGSVVLATANVAASILAGNSTVNELSGTALITFRTIGSTGTASCNGFLEFQTATATTKVDFSTAADNNSPTNDTKTINTTSAALVDVTQSWSTAAATQGTTISQVILKKSN